MNKHAAIELSLEELIKVALLALITIVFFVPLGLRLWGWFVPSIDKETDNNLVRIVSEINDLKGSSSSSIKVPVYFPVDTYVSLFDNDYQALPSQCKKKSCICAFKSSGDTSLSKCYPLDDIDVEPKGFSKEILDVNVRKLQTLDISLQKVSKRFNLMISQVKDVQSST